MEESLFHHSESFVYQAANWVKLTVEVVGVLVIAYGLIHSLWCYGGQLFGREDTDYVPLRLSLARYLVVALEFQLAADILGTAIAPNWDSIGKLAAIAVIRTVLNYFLQQEMEKEIEMEESGMNEKMDRRMEDDDKLPGRREGPVSTTAAYSSSNKA